MKKALGITILLLIVVVFFTACGVEAVPQVDMPLVWSELVPNSYQRRVFMNASSGVRIYYTAANVPAIPATPTANNTRYVGPITINVPTTFKVIAVREHMLSSDVVEKTVITSVYTPTAVPLPGVTIATNTYASAQTVHLSSATADATIYYITGTTSLAATPAPTTSSTRYTNPISITSTTYLKAFAVKDDMPDSPVLTATYTISP